MVAKKNYADMSGQGVMNALGSVTINQAMVDYFTGRQEEWKFFGKMNSHLYRQQLFARMEEKGLDSEAMMLVYAMSSIIKSQPRIVQAMIDTPENERFATRGVWFAVRNFFDSECTQYVSTARRDKKFPVVNIPNTMPGLDILWFCLCTKDEDRIMDNLKIRPTFSQMSLMPDVQTVAKEGYEYFWNEIVKGTRNSDNVERPMMREEYYQNSASDMYRLITLTATNSLTLLAASHTSGRYSMAEVENYLRSFDRPTPSSPTGS
jgi:hypothetical protein